MALLLTISQLKLAIVLIGQKQVPNG